MKYFKLPDLGEGLQEAEIVEWHIKPGDDVKEDQLILSVETAKAIVDVPSPQSGTIAALFGAEGDIIHTGEPLLEYANAEDDDTEMHLPAIFLIIFMTRYPMPITGNENTSKPKAVA